MRLTAAQRAYMTARAGFDALDASRDRLLALIDSGACPALSPAQQQELDWLNARQAEVYPLVLAAEQPLLDWARHYLTQCTADVRQHPACAVLARQPIPPGMRDRAIELAMRLGTKEWTDG